MRLHVLAFLLVPNTPDDALMDHAMPLNHHHHHHHVARLLYWMLNLHVE
jgi:hypothetical protein